MFSRGVAVDLTCPSHPMHPWWFIRPIPPAQRLAPGLAEGRGSPMRGEVPDMCPPLNLPVRLR